MLFTSHKKDIKNETCFYLIINCESLSDIVYMIILFSFGNLLENINILSLSNQIFDDKGLFDKQMNKKNLFPRWNNATLE